MDVDTHRLTHHNFGINSLILPSKPRFDHTWLHSPTCVGRSWIVGRISVTQLNTHARNAIFFPALVLHDRTSGPDFNKLKVLLKQKFSLDLHITYTFGPERITTDLWEGLWCSPIPTCICLITTIFMYHCFRIHIRENNRCSWPTTTAA